MSGGTLDCGVKTLAHVLVKWLKSDCRDLGHFFGRRWVDSNVETVMHVIFVVAVQEGGRKIRRGSQARP